MHVVMVGTRNPDDSPTKPVEHRKTKGRPTNVLVQGWMRSQSSRHRAIERPSMDGACSACDHHPHNIIAFMEIYINVNCWFHFLVDLSLLMVISQLTWMDCCCMLKFQGNNRLDPNLIWLRSLIQLKKILKLVNFDWFG
jgi:hypothetical protein